MFVGSPMDPQSQGSNFYTSPDAEIPSEGENYYGTRRRGVHGEPPQLFPVCEDGWEFIETPFQHFEEVPQTLASTETVTEDPPMKMASFKDARDVVEKGGCANWGQLPNFAHKTNKFGLGFTA